MKNLMLFHTLEVTFTYPYGDSIWNPLENRVETWSETFDTMEELELQLEMLWNRSGKHQDSPVITNVIIDGVEE